ncbi:MAG: alkaline phosphatase family protein [Bacteroidales bacterium]|nr:alkaline phosphatase family protein [Bacteroidales bacterium]
MQSIRHLFTILLLAAFFHCFSQEKPADPPRLVIGIKIDGLQANHLHRIWRYFTPDGFRKIAAESAVAEKMHHNIVSAGNSSDAATFITGTYPFFHGVCGDNYYSRFDNQVLSVLHDKNQAGIGTKEKISAHRLLASTISDELILSNPLSQVHCVAIEPEDAVMLGGHNATSVTWIDDVANRWVTTTYYSKGLSRWADLMNVDGSFKRIISERWVPSAAVSTFINPTAKGSRTIPFSYNPTSRRKGYSVKNMIRNTPAANSLVTELGRTIFEKERLGTDKNTDLLLLQYTVKIPNQVGSSLATAEQEDMYIRLDRDIQSLLSFASSKIGAENLLVFVVGSGTDFHSPIELGKNQIPAGFFNADRALALLNTYLMAIYGQEKWVTGYYGKNVFLNRKKIEDKKLNLSEFHARITEFMIEFEGVQAAYSASNIINYAGETNDMYSKFRNSFHKNTSGDIVLTLMPGWVEVDNDGRVVGEANSPQSFVPFYVMGKGIKPQQILNANTIDIAPTLAYLMGIPEPNASIGKVLYVK